MRLTPVPSTEPPGVATMIPAGLAPAPRRPMASDQQVPLVKLNAGDTANAWSAALPAALTWLWQQLAPPDLRVLFPVHAGAPGLFSTLPVPPVKGHDPRSCCAIRDSYVAQKRVGLVAEDHRRP